MDLGHGTCRRVLAAALLAALLGGEGAAAGAEVGREVGADARARAGADAHAGGRTHADARTQPSRYARFAGGDEPLALSDLGPHAVELERSRFVAMRDGVRLSTDVYRPVGAQGRLPAILMRTPYGKSLRRPPAGARFFASRGYVVLVQDLRGRHESEGRYFAYSAQEGEDGWDTLDWIVAQPWSNGRVGTYGCSYLGEVQAMLARLKHPAHRAAVIQGAMAYRGPRSNVTILGFANNGVLELASAYGWNRELGGARFAYGPPPDVDREAWFRSDAAALYRTQPVLPDVEPMLALSTLPLTRIPEVGRMPPSFFTEWLVNPPPAHYWRRIGGFSDEDTFAVPALHVASWYDYTYSARIGFDLFRDRAVDARTREHQYLLIAPGAHCEPFESRLSDDDRRHGTLVGERRFGDTRYDWLRHYLDWFDRWLRDARNDVAKTPPVQYFEMGTNRWLGAAEWPPAHARTQTFYLASDGRANSRWGDGALLHAPAEHERADAFVYDPATPVPSRGGMICCTGRLGDDGGAKDQSEVQVRADVLVYQTPALDAPLSLTGNASVVLHVSSSAPDTDFTAKLVERDAAGRSWIVTDGVVRLRWRNGLCERAPPMRPGEIVEVTIDLEATSLVIAAGHRLQLEVSSSSFPRFERNLNTGGANYDEPAGIAATNRVHHGRRYPSRLVIAGGDVAGPALASEARRVREELR